MNNDKRHERITLNFTKAEVELLNVYYWDYGRSFKKQVFLRGLLLGDIPHPTAKIESDLSSPLNDAIRPVGKQEPGLATAFHYLGYVLAGYYLELDTDPKKREMLAKHSDQYRQIVGTIHNYLYDPKTGHRSAMPKPK